MQQKKAFFKNAMVLTASSFLLRGVGMVFRVYISNILGAEGMGLYQMIFSVYVLASTLASAGLTMAVTRMVSEEQVRASRKAIRGMMAKLLAASAVLGCATAAALFFFSPFIGGTLLGDARSVPSLKVLSLSVPLMAVSASLRGYFMARRRIPFTAFTQVLEQVIRFAGCVVLLAVLGADSLGPAIFAVMASDSLSELSSFLLQGGALGKDLKKLPEAGAAIPKKPSVLARLCAIALPIAAVRGLGSGLGTIESILVPQRMAVYFGGASGALAAWGQLKGMALPLLMFPSSFISSFVMLLVPEFSENAVTRHDGENRLLTARAMHLTLASSIGIAALFLLLGNQMGTAVYNDPGIGFYLIVLAPLTPLIYAESVAEGLLKGLDQQMSTLWFTLINSVVRIALIWPLCAQLGMKGFLYVMLVSNVLTSFLHQRKLLRVTGLKLQWRKWVIKPLASAAIGLCLAAPVLRMTESAGVWVQLAAGGGVCGAAYLVALYATGCVRREDIFGKRLKKAKSPRPARGRG
ncbi:MAG: oligosaccharide flippase family protein [Oscillospiraceae bacterium]|nr:oligosaccharide flippase family protein [Oscillospiraceae bacterium]